MNSVTAAPARLYTMTRLQAITATLIGTAIAMTARSAHAASSSTLKQDDFVGISFWIISMALVASTVFFFLERDRRCDQCHRDDPEGNPDEIVLLEG